MTDTHPYKIEYKMGMGHTFILPLMGERGERTYSNHYYVLDHIEHRLNFQPTLDDIVKTKCLCEQMVGVITLCKFRKGKKRCDMCKWGGDLFPWDEQDLKLVNRYDYFTEYE